MKTADLKTSLLCMGYRKLNETIWAKPFGFQVFKVDTSTSEIAVYFMGTNEKVHCYISEQLNQDYDFTQAIALFESVNSKHYPRLKNFGFFTELDKTNLIMDAIEGK